MVAGGREGEGGSYASSAVPGFPILRAQFLLFDYYSTTFYTFSLIGKQRYVSVNVEPPLPAHWYSLSRTVQLLRLNPHIHYLLVLPRLCEHLSPAIPVNTSPDFFNKTKHLHRINDHRMSPLLLCSASFFVLTTINTHRLEFGLGVSRTTTHSHEHLVVHGPCRRR